MHIPDGFISLPVNIGTYLVSGGTFVYSMYSANKKLQLQQIPLLAVSAAFIFAAQMINFPIAIGTSGHFLGSVLAMVLLGPLFAFVAMSLVLIMQTLLFADGGLLAMGSNIFNMGFIGTIVGFFIFMLIIKVLPKTKPMFLVATFVVSWLSIVLASASCSVMLGISGTYDLVPALVSMVSVHALIGIGEAIITTAVVSLVLTLRPDLVALWNGEKA